MQQEVRGEEEEKEAVSDQMSQVEKPTDLIQFTHTKNEIEEVHLYHEQLTL